MKLTDPPTAVLYITPDWQHLQELKHTIHVKEVNLGELLFGAAGPSRVRGREASDDTEAGWWCVMCLQDRRQLLEWLVDYMLNILCCAGMMVIDLYGNDMEC